MDDFNNFFDDQREPEKKEATPIYHTPEPKKDNKHSTIVGISIILSVVMCLVIVINVIVLASLKNQIANEYAKSLSQIASNQYAEAINDVLEDSDIVNDIKETVTEKVSTTITSDVGEIANEKCTASVARIYMYKTSTSTKCSTLATAFLITDYTTSSPERYLITNAHCCRYLDLIEKISKGKFGMSYVSYSLEWKSYEKILCYFENDDTEYTTEIVAYGSYDDSTYDNYVQVYNLIKPIDNNQADLAILKITGTQPSNETHPSLKITSKANSPQRGDSIAIVGNPEGMGTTTSISTGVVSQTGITISSWGAGSFTMTDAAINGGNSGGPMINKNGYVVGVVESKLVATDIDNMGFALDNSTLIDFIAWAETQNSITINYSQV